MTYDEARETVPADAECTASFGYPGEGGYAEYWRAAGRRWIITNGTYLARAPFTWAVEECAA